MSHNMPSALAAVNSPSGEEKGFLLLLLIFALWCGLTWFVYQRNKRKRIDPSSEGVPYVGRQFFGCDFGSHNSESDDDHRRSFDDDDCWAYRRSRRSDDWPFDSDDCGSDFLDEAVNPASGLYMCGSMDSAGNLYGSDDSFHSAFDD